MLLIAFENGGVIMTLQQDQFVKSFESETKTRPILQRYHTQMKPELELKMLEVCRRTSKAGTQFRNLV